jgi:hypothetical protein
MRQITQPAGPKTPVILSGELTAVFEPEVRFDLVLDRRNQRKLLVYKTQRTEFYLAARNVGETKGYRKLSGFPT